MWRPETRLWWATALLILLISWWRAHAGKPATPAASAATPQVSAKLEIWNLPDQIPEAKEPLQEWLGVVNTGTVPLVVLRIDDQDASHLAQLVDPGTATLIYMLPDTPAARQVPGHYEAPGKHVARHRVLVAAPPADFIQATGGAPFDASGTHLCAAPDPTEPPYVRDHVCPPPRALDSDYEKDCVLDPVEEAKFQQTLAREFRGTPPTSWKKQLGHAHIMY